MLRTAMWTAVLVVVSLSAQAQDGRKPAVSGGKAVDTAGKAALPVGPVLAGEEKLSARERAERTFLMPPRKKMPSVQPAPITPATATEASAVAIGPPTEAEMAADEAAKAEAAAPAVAPRSTTRRHYSPRRRSHAAASRSSKKKSSAKKKSSSRRRR